jgi:hypothetical protein
MWEDIAAQIYQAALAGNSVNPGLPPAMAEFLVGQAANESNYGSSNFAVNNNNYFGYECDSSSTWQDGCSSTDADNATPVGNYDTLNASVQELVDWWYRRAADGKGGCPSDLTTITSVKQYTDILKRAGYFTSNETSYMNNIMTAIQNLGQNFFKH